MKYPRIGNRWATSGELVAGLGLLVLMLLGSAALVVAAMITHGTDRAAAIISLIAIWVGFGCSIRWTHHRDT